MGRVWRYGGLLGLGLVAVVSAASAAPNPACFARALPEAFRGGRLDDVKFLIGFVFDVAVARQEMTVSSVIDRHSGLSEVPGFAGPTDLTHLVGAYRVMRAPFDEGHGYFGVLLGSLDQTGRVTALILANRLFRLPVVTHDPVGLLTDIVTNGAMWTGWWTRAVTDANHAAAVAAVTAAALKVPLLMVGQSQAGGVAQVQAAYVAATYPRRPVLTGFITFNAGFVGPSIRRLGSTVEAVDGINFIKDLDPGFGPHGLLPSRAGLRVYVHPDGSGSGVPGRQFFLAAWLHPAQHMLSSFNDVLLAPALAATVAGASDRCDGRPGIAG